MPNVKRAAVAGFSGLAMIAAAVVGGSSAAATESAPSPASTTVAAQAGGYELSDITQPPWHLHSTHGTLGRCRLAQNLLDSTGSVRETKCQFGHTGLWWLMYRG